MKGECIIISMKGADLLAISRTEWTGDVASVFEVIWTILCVSATL